MFHAHQLHVPGLKPFGRTLLIGSHWAPGLNSAVFKRDLTEVSQVQEIPRRGTAVEKMRDAKYEVTAGFENKHADGDRSCTSCCTEY